MAQGVVGLLVYSTITLRNGRNRTAIMFPVHSTVNTRHKIRGLSHTGKKHLQVVLLTAIEVSTTGQKCQRLTAIQIQIEIRIVTRDVIVVWNCNIFIFHVNLKLFFSNYFSSDGSQWKALQLHCSSGAIEKESLNIKNITWISNVTNISYFRLKRHYRSHPVFQ